MKSQRLGAALLAGAVLVAGTLGGRARAGEAIRVGKAVEEIPAWAKTELANLDKAETALLEFVRRFTGPEGNTLGGENAGHGAIDDRMEGLFRWDRYLVLAGSDDLRLKFLRLWKWCWRYGVGRGIFRHGFYRGSYDAEHACELFPMLWVCMELFPDDAELTAVNRRLADMLSSPTYFHPKNHFLRYSAMNVRLTAATAPQAMRKHRGDNALNTQYTAGVWLAYLTTGQEKYRKWVLDYSRAWNKAAAGNNGILPFGVETDALKLGPNGNGEWWKANAGFGYEDWGMNGSSMGFNSLFTAAVYLDGGDPVHGSGLVSTVKTLFANTDEKGLPPSAYSPKHGGWYRTIKGGRTVWPHHIPCMLQRAYVLTWSPEVKKLISKYPIAAVTYREKNLARWNRFTYTGEEKMAFAEGALGGGIKVNRLWKGMIKSARGSQPRGGDSQRDASPVPSRYNLDLIDGGQWAAANGRAGGPSTSEVGYFDRSGRRRLPTGVAALVRHSEKGLIKLYLCNSNGRPVALTLTGGFYGQHRIDAIEAGEVKGKPGARLARLTLAPKSVAELTVRITRCMYVPSLKPQSDVARTWK